MKEKDRMAPLLGAHMSIAGGIPNAVGHALRAECNALQIFVKNSNRWKGRALGKAEVEEFRSDRKAAGLKIVVAHNSYLINLASPKEDLRKKSREALIDELDRSERLGLEYLVIHPGAHTGSGEATGLQRIAQALDQIREEVGELHVKIALEMTAGQGTTLGYRFEHFRDILAKVGEPKDYFLCLDTCHAFAAGFDFRTEAGYASMMDRLEHTVGLERLTVLHLNDSKRELGSRVDRHEHIGEGQIGDAGFAWFMNDPRLQSVPKILETPKGKDNEQDRRNLDRLRSLLGRTFS